VKQVNFNRSFDELAAQFTMAKNMIDRYDALLELKKTEVSKKRAMLIQRFGVEKFHLIKTEIISQLADDTDAATLDMFRKAITDKDAAVRRSVSANLKTIDPSLRTDVEQLLSDSSYQVIMNALDNLCFNFPEQVESYLEKTKNMNGNLFHNVRIKWLELAYDKSKDAKYLIDLRHYADINRYDNPSASAAISAMKRINYLDEVLLDYLFNAATYWSAPVNTPAKTALSFYYEQNAYRKLIKSKFKMLSPEMKDGLKDVIK
jgi:hypothetical protein